MLNRGKYLDNKKNVDKILKYIKDKYGFEYTDVNEISTTRFVKVVNDNNDERLAKRYLYKVNSAIDACYGLHLSKEIENRKGV